MGEHPLSKEVYDRLISNATHSECLIRRYSSAIVKDDCIIGIGYSVMPHCGSCTQSGVCGRQVLQSKFGFDLEFFESCPIIHAEMAAILSCDRIRDCEGATLYLLGINRVDGSTHKDAFPCTLCLRHILHVGIRTVCIVQDKNACLKFDLREGGLNDHSESRYRKAH